VLSFALRSERIKKIHALEDKRYFLSSISQTFHGRDIFAPVAAHLSKGLPIQKLGPKRKDFVQLKWPEPRRRQGCLEGEVVYVDRFGNAITNLDAKLLAASKSALCEIYVGRARRCSLKTCYQAVPVGKPVAVIGSSNFLEIAINGGSAAKRLALKIGSPVTLR
jgi:S-adenosylmethionine hydrolase